MADLASLKNRRWVALGPTPVHDKDGGVSKLVLQTDQPLAPLAPGEALVRVKAAGVAYTDLMVIRGTYFKSFPWPRVPGYDWVGEVVALGPPKDGDDDRAKAVAVGDVVGAMTSVGGFQDYVAWPAADLVRVPPEVTDYGQAVAMLLNYTTAHMLLHEAAKPRFRAGSTVLVHSAAGGTGSALVELCKLAGAGQVFGTCSGKKADAVRALGATPIDYKTTDFVDAVRKATEGKGVDVVFDAIGGSHVARSRDALSDDGRLVMYGFTGAEASGSNALAATLSTFGRLASYYVASKLWTRRTAYFFGIVLVKEKDPALFHRHAAACMALLKDGAIKPLIDSRVAFEDVPAALHRVATLAQVGKVVMEIHPPPSSAS